jgi:SAM-dependent methyltransferase
VSTEDSASHIKSQYLADNAWARARERLAALEASRDPGTIRHLERLGVARAWHCLEVGGGGGSITEWLCRKVGPMGHVVATDLDPRFLEAIEAPNLEVRRHNILSDDLEAGAFDLVHTRAVLQHLAERDQALGRMVAALKPGGWLLVEESDFRTSLPDPRTGAVESALFLKLSEARWQLLTAAGFDWSYGQRLYGDLRVRGLTDMGAEGRVGVVQGDTPEAQFLRLTMEQMRDRLPATGWITADEVAAALVLLDDPEFIYQSAMMMAVWGRRSAP